MFGGDLTWAGLAFAAIGALWLLRRRPGDALLMASGGAAVTAFAVGYAVPDVPVFVIPALLCLWLFAATGCEQAFRFAATCGAGRRRLARGARSGGAGASRLARVAPRATRRSQRRPGGRAAGGAAVRGAAAAIGDRVRRLHRRPHAAVRAARPRSATRARNPIGPRDAAALRALLASETPMWPSRRPSIASASRDSTSRRRRWRSSMARSPTWSAGCRAAPWWRWRCQPNTRAASQPASARRIAAWRGGAGRGAISRSSA